MSPAPNSTCTETSDCRGAKMCQNNSKICIIPHLTHKCKDVKWKSLKIWIGFICLCLFIERASYSLLYVACTACVCTSPQPLADITRRTVMLMLPPPFPLCVESEPDSTAVSEFVKGAWRKTKKKQPDKTDKTTLQWNQVRKANTWVLYLYGLGNVHLVDFNMRKASSWHLLKVLIVTVKQVCCIHTHADGALNNE